MAQASDALRATLDRLALPYELADDREYLISMLRRLGYTEREIEMELGIRLDGSESKTIELEYSEAKPAQPEPAPTPPPAATPKPETKPAAKPVPEPAPEPAITPEPAPEPVPEPEPEPARSHVREAELLDFSPRGPPAVRPQRPRSDMWRRAGDDVDGQFAYKVDYRLYYRDVRLPTGRVQRIYFFSRSIPKVGIPCDLPEGYEVCENSRTGLPFLAKVDRPREPGEQETIPARRGLLGRRREAHGLLAVESLDKEQAALPAGNQSPEASPGEEQEAKTNGIWGNVQEPEEVDWSPPEDDDALDEGMETPEVQEDGDTAEEPDLEAQQDKTDTPATPTTEVEVDEEDSPVWSFSDDAQEDTTEEGEVEAATPDDGGFRHGDYTLYRRMVPWSGGGMRQIHFFERQPPLEGDPAPLPPGHAVRVNERTGMPYLVKADDAVAPKESKVRVKVIRAASPEEAVAKARRAGLNVRGTVPVEVEADDDQ